MVAGMTTNQKHVVPQFFKTNLTGVMIEEAYQNRRPTLSLNHGFFALQGGYTIDFNRMTQSNQRNSRMIRRIPEAEGASTAPAQLSPFGLPVRVLSPFTSGSFPMGGFQLFVGVCSFSFLLLREILFNNPVH